MSVRQGNKIIAGIPDVSGKANTDADNFTADGKQSITSWGFPSDKFIDLSLGASGAKITVPADGYISLEATTTADKSFVRLKSDFLSSISFLNTGNIVSAFLPVKKGEEILIEHRTIKNHIFRFIYAEGEK